MKRAFRWVFAAAVLVFVIDWGVAGVKIFSGDYDIVVEAYVALGCLAVFTGFVVVRLFSERCPHCGRLHLTKGEFFSFCGKRIG